MSNDMVNISLSSDDENNRKTQSRSSFKPLQTGWYLFFIDLIAGT